MPNITQYNNPDVRINEEGFQQAARRISAFGVQRASTVEMQGKQFANELDRSIVDAGEAADQYIDYMDKSKISAKSTQGLAQLDQSWEQTLKGVPDPNNPGKFLVQPADPNDPNTARKFQQEQIEPFLTDLQKTPIGERGTQYAQAKADEIREHLSIKLMASMSSQAGLAVQLNHVRTINGLATSVSIDPSFRNVDFALKQAQDDLNSHLGSPTLKAEQVGKLRLLEQENDQRIVHSAAVAAIMKEGADPEAVAQSFLKRYPDYIKPDEAISLAKSAKMQAKQNEFYNKEIAAADKQAKMLTAQKSVNDIAERVDTGQTTVPEARKMLWSAVNQNVDGFAAHGELARSTSDWLNSRGTKEEGKEFDPVVFNTLSKGLLTGDTTEQKLMDAEVNDKITQKQFEFLWGNVKKVKELGIKTEPFEAAMKAVDPFVVDRMDPTGDAVGQGEKAAFTNEFIAAYTAAMRSPGGPPPNALDMSDPKSMIRQMLAPHILTMQQKINLRAAQAAADVPVKGLTLSPPAQQVKPPEGFPLAQRFSDGRWYVKQNNQWLRVKE